jgi:hypothetical protein
MLSLLIVIIIFYAAGIWFSPFPYWTTYWILWRHVLFKQTAEINFTAKVRQADLLINYTLLTPFWTMLWYIDDLLYPKYKKMQVRPVFIIGEPRSGTTLLHRTLGADSTRYFAIRHIEWRYPYIIVQKLIEAFGLAQRLKQVNYWPDNAVGQEAARMHPNNLYDFEEDGIFYEERFLHHFFTYLRFPYPDLLTYLDDYPSLPPRVKRRILNAHQKVVKKVLYLRGDPNLNYLSKEVTSHNKIPDLLERYPDARFIVIIRPACEFMDSLLALVRNSTAAKTGIDPVDIPEWKAVFIERMRQDSELLATLCEAIIPKHKQVRLNFAEFTADIYATVCAIYKQMGENPSANYLHYLEGVASLQKKRERGYNYKTGTTNGFERFDELATAIEGHKDLNQGHNI